MQKTLEIDPSRVLLNLWLRGEPVSFDAVLAETDLFFDELRLKLLSQGWTDEGIDACSDNP